MIRIQSWEARAAGLNAKVDYHGSDVQILKIKLPKPSMAETVGVAVQMFASAEGESLDEGAEVPLPVVGKTAMVYEGMFTNGSVLA